MSGAVDFARITSAVNLLEQIEPAARLTALENLIINNGGRWDFPSERIEEYNPAILEIQLFGVPAMASEMADLPKNWLKAANNMIEAQADDEKAGVAA